MSTQKNFAASFPSTQLPSNSVSILRLTSITPKQVFAAAGYKMNFWQKLQWKLVQKKLKRTATEDPQKTKDTVSTLALISGTSGLVLLFVVPALGFLLMLGGVVMGIIGLNKNLNRKSRTKALIGLIAGSVGIVFVAAIIIAFASTFN